MWEGMMFTWETHTGCSWRYVPMCWRRQRGGSVALRRQTPLSSQTSCSCFCSTHTFLSSVSFGHDSCRFHHLSISHLKTNALLNRLFVSLLRKANFGPLIADPCQEKASRLCEVQLKSILRAKSLRLLWTNNYTKEGANSGTWLAFKSLVNKFQLKGLVDTLMERKLRIFLTFYYFSPIQQNNIAMHWKIKHISVRPQKLTISASSADLKARAHQLMALLILI